MSVKQEPPRERLTSGLDGRRDLSPHIPTLFQQLSSGDLSGFFFFSCHIFLVPVESHGVQQEENRKEKVPCCPIREEAFFLRAWPPKPVCAWRLALEITRPSAVQISASAMYAPEMLQSVTAPFYLFSRKTHLQGDGNFTCDNLTVSHQPSGTD